jgi:23S rRNA (guanosine2251-2'-O)-methyltransferase
MLKQNFKSKKKDSHQKEKQKPKNDGLLIYGKHAVVSCINSGRREIKQIYCTAKIAPDIKEIATLKNPALSDRFKVVEKEFLDGLLEPEAVHQGCAILCTPLPYTAIEDVVNPLKEDDNCTLLILDQVTDTRNIGAIVRSAVAFNVNGIIFPNTHSPKENAAMVKAAAGGMEVINLIEVSNLQNTIKYLQKNGFWVIGLDSDTEKTLSDIPKFNKTVLILGSEDTGMRELTRKSCDFIAKIPMNNKAMESLNISNACAIALYEVFKSRQ